MMQECLSLRQKYVFREAVPPWRRDPATLPMPDPDDPFRFQPVAATEVGIGGGEGKGEGGAEAALQGRGGEPGMVGSGWLLGAL